MEKNYIKIGVLMYRGFTLDQFMNQCYVNVQNGGKGKLFFNNILSLVSNCHYMDQII